MTVSRFNFRVWDKENKYFLPRFFVDEDGNVLYYYRLATFHMGNPSIRVETIYLDKEDYVLMQSTGMVDKNGKQIFEGDVVVGNCQQFVVCFQDCQFVLKKIHRYEEKEYDYSLCCFEKHNIEVIGNIYKNPELLKE